MNIVLSHYSAFAFWNYVSLPESSERDFAALLCRPAKSSTNKRPLYKQSAFQSAYLKRLLSQERVVLPDNFKLSINKKEREALCELLHVSYPLQVIAPRGTKRKSDLDTEVHVGASYRSAKQIIDIAPGLSVCSPELVFIQLSRLLDISKLIYLGHEMCGSFCSTPLINDGLQSRPPLCSVKSIASTLSGINSIGNKPKLKTALETVLDGAASPPEAQLAMFLTTPRARGGSGFKAPLPNGIVLTDNRSQILSGKRWRACDLYWPRENVAIEYDSEAHHSTTEQRCNDAIRRNALVAAGIKILSVTPGQLRDYKEMQRLEVALARSLKIRQRTRTIDYENKHRKYHEEVCKWCPRWRNDLFKVESLKDDTPEEEPEGRVFGRRQDRYL